MTLYTPKAFKADESFGWQLAAEHPFALCIVPPEPLVVPIPFVVDAASRTLIGHVARANPIAARIADASVTVVFQGPHAYVSPRWYTSPSEQVPTWNYVTAVARGPARVLERDELASLLDRLAAAFEPADGWRASRLERSFFDDLMRGIVGFSIEVTEMQAKQKLSQNRSPADRAGVIAGLEAQGDEPELLTHMRALYERR